MPQDEPTRSGWLPPQPPEPSGWSAPKAPPRPAYRPSGGYQPVQRPPSSPTAVAGIVVGVAALVVVVLSAGTGFAVGAVLGASALLLARSARRQLDTGRPGRPGQVRAASLLGIAALVVAVIAMVIWLVLDANGVSQQDLLDWLERERERLQAR